VLVGGGGGAEEGFRGLYVDVSSPSLRGGGGGGGVSRSEWGVGSEGGGPRESGLLSQVAAAQGLTSSGGSTFYFFV
jgi:hypothetical protein